MSSPHLQRTAINTPFQVLFASLIGTTIEFFDFYIYGTAAVLVFPRLFFPTADPASATLASLATFGVAFVARPIGSLLFGHFGDRIGRKTTLVLALLCMGLSTFAIGALPGYGTIGLAAPVLLTLCRFGQGIGLGGEWGGAVLLAVENAPKNKRAIYGMFPQFGAPIGFLFSGGSFLLLSEWLTEEQFFSFGWRIPFLASAVLVLMGLYVRLKIPGQHQMSAQCRCESCRADEFYKTNLAANAKQFERPVFQAGPNGCESRRGYTLPRESKIQTATPAIIKMPKTRTFPAVPVALIKIVPGVTFT